MKAFPELTAALREMLDRMVGSLRAGGCGHSEWWCFPALPPCHGG